LFKFLCLSVCVYLALRSVCPSKYFCLCLRVSFSLCMPPETVGHLEELKSSSHRMRDWMRRSKETTFRHLRDIMQVNDKITSLKERVLALMTVCVEFKDLKDQHLPHLKSLMETSVDDLLHVEVIEEGRTYNFSS